MDRDPSAAALVFGDTTLDHAALEARSFALARQDGRLLRRKEAA